MMNIRFIATFLIFVPIALHAGPNESPPIYWAALANDVNMAKCYVDRGEPINIVDKHGMSPLMYAADKGNYEMVKFLLEAGADPLTKSKNGALAAEMGKRQK